MDEAPRLLIVDDEPAVLKLAKTILSTQEYKVTICGGGLEALKILEQVAFDLVITDAMMPGMTGYELVKHIRNNAKLAEIPVLMLTRKRNRQDVKEAVEAGVTDYIVKPIDADLLLDKVEQCLKKGTGKNHVFECSVNGEHAKAEIHLPCQITSISESAIGVRLAFEIHPTLPMEIKSPILDEIGIEMPMMKLLYCRTGTILPDAKHLPFEAKFAFVGVEETDLRKIRNWLQKEELRRRK